MDQSFEKPPKAKMVSSSATQNLVAEDGSLSPRNLPVKENNISINSIVLLLISFYSGKQKIFSQVMHVEIVK